MDLIVRRSRLVATLLALLYAAVLAATAPAMGYTRDEGYYFKAAEQYDAWWDTLFSRRFLEAFDDKEIQLRFGYNTEHPAAVKLLQGLSFRVLHRWLGVTGPAQGFRFTGFLFAALSLFATFLLGRDTVSAPAGLLAAIFVATIPRYFYDAHLACFDVPITAMWTLAAWAYYRALEAEPDRARKTALAAGVMFGLALATKLNAMFLPPVFVVLWLFRSWARPSNAGAALAFVPGPSGSRDLQLPPIPWALISCAILGPLIFIALWPHLWHDTFNRIGGYIGFHIHHEHYPIRYFGNVYVKPPFPWHFSWMMTVLTLPGPMLALAALGLLVAAVRTFARRSTADLLLIAGALLPILLISTPGTPIFGGVKHWYNAMPFLAVLAARTLLESIDRISAGLAKLARPAKPALAALACLPGLLGIIASHPNGIAFYNELAGGPRGAAELGMQRSFWGGVSRPLMSDVARQPMGTRVFFDHTNYDAYRMYVREGTLPGTINFANTPEEAQAATTFEDREGYPPSEEAVWSSVGIKPSDGVYLDEVTIVQFYPRPTGPTGR